MHLNGIYRTLFLPLSLFGRQAYVRTSTNIPTYSPFPPPPPPELRPEIHCHTVPTPAAPAPATTDLETGPSYVYVVRTYELHGLASHAFTHVQLL